MLSTLDRPGLEAHDRFPPLVGALAVAPVPPSGVGLVTNVGEVGRSGNVLAVLVTGLKQVSIELNLLQGQT